MSEPVIRVRRAVQADARAIGEAHGSAWEAAYGHVFEQPFLRGRGRQPAARVAGRDRPLLIAPSFVLVAELDGLVLGFAHGAPAGDGEPVGRDPRLLQSARRRGAPAPRPCS